MRSRPRLASRFFWGGGRGWFGRGAPGGSGSLRREHGFRSNSNKAIRGQENYARFALRAVVVCEIGATLLYSVSIFEMPACTPFQRHGVGVVGPRARGCKVGAADVRVEVVWIRGPNGGHRIKMLLADELPLELEAIKKQA